MLRIVAYQRFSNDNTRESIRNCLGHENCDPNKKMLCAFIFVTIGLSVLLFTRFLGD